MKKKFGICPLLSCRSSLSDEDKSFISNEITLCYKNRCAWWVDKQKCCAMALLPACLSDIAEFSQR